jgi:hypothetical protein
MIRLAERFRTAWWGFKNPGEKVGYETAIAYSYEVERLAEHVTRLRAENERLRSMLGAFDDLVEDPNGDEEYE